MGTDMHTFAEVRQPDGAWHPVTDRVFPGDWDDDVDRYVTFTAHPFEGPRDRIMFDLFADPGDSIDAPVVDRPRGLPRDVSPPVRDAHGPDLDQISPWGYAGWHGASWLLLAELLAVDYSAVVSSETFGSGSLRDALGEWYFDTVDVLESLGSPDAVRIVVWFSS